LGVKGAQTAAAIGVRNVLLHKKIDAATKRKP